MDARPATTSTTTVTTNPPSVEIAYKRKCAALKKRLAEVEAENDLMRTRNLRGYQYIQKMRLESCMLLERLAKVTGMADEAAAGKADPELRARATAMMSNATALNGIGAGAGAQGEEGADLDDETEGSSDEQPPTPEERPLRVKRSRKSNLPVEGGDADDAAQENAGEAGDADTKSSSLPRLAPAPSQKDLTSSFRVRKGSGARECENGVEADDRDAGSDAQAGDAAEDEATPMEVDDKEPKEEQG